MKVGIGQTETIPHVLAGFRCRGGSVRFPGRLTVSAMGRALTGLYVTVNLIGSQPVQSIPPCQDGWAGSRCLVNRVGELCGERGWGGRGG